MPAPVAAAAAGGKVAGGAAAGGAGGGAAGGGAAGGGAAGGGGARGVRGAAGARGGQGRAPSGGAQQNAGSGGQQQLSPQDLQRMLRALEDDEQREEQDDGGGGGSAVALLLLSFVIGFVLLVVILLFPMFLVAGIVGGDEAARQDPCGGTDCAVLGEIPPLAVPFREMYEDAARVYRVNPFLLMAVHESESTYGTGLSPGIVSGLNLARCCAGPMQFSITGGADTRVGGTGGTWATYADAYRSATINRPTNYPNQFSPHPNVYDSFDAIYAAAKYFASLGAGPELDDDTYAALLRYKGVPPYSEPFARHDYARAKELERRSGTAVGGALAAMYQKASQIAAEGPPYTWGGGHASFDGPYDCSGLVSAVLHAGGLISSPTDTVGLLSWGLPGRGRTFTVWSRGAGTGGHAFLEFHFNGQSRFIEANGPSGTPAGWRTGKDTSSYTARHWRGM